MNYFRGPFYDHKVGSFTCFMCVIHCAAAIGGIDSHFINYCIRRNYLTLRLLMSYIYDISSLRFNDLTLILLTWRKW